MEGITTADLYLFLAVPLAVWILLSGADDLLVDGMGLLAAMQRRLHRCPSRRELLRLPQKAIAIFVPCWQESAVIGQMIERNRDRIGYGNYRFFIGAYPNDGETLAAIRALEARFPNVHLALCPSPGPTSKADCLNGICAAMNAFETLHGVRFDIVVTHDAEDVIHPDSLHWINWHAGHSAMVQMPVLPIPTPLGMWTHGLYCDEFGEYQARDMPARQWMGAFVPSNGVGAGFRRDALDRLAAGGGIFEPVCLTEDYENGLRLKQLGVPQHFVSGQNQGLATREYFPCAFRAAVRQRTRWATGIALQTWERHGWNGSLADRYWLWRDRRGLLTNPASLLANALLPVGFVLRAEIGPEAAEYSGLFAATLVISAWRLLYRMGVSRRLFGWRFALGVPVRVILGNVINTLAALCALHRFFAARLSGRPLVWLKTSHSYPAAETANTVVSLAELLVRHGYLSSEQCVRAQSACPQGVEFSRFVLSEGLITEDDLCEALSLQHGLPVVCPAPDQVRSAVARSLPLRILKHWRVLPFDVEDGKLLIAGVDPPGPEMLGDLQRFTPLDIRYHLMPESRALKLASQLL